jgi:hypothetical protein
MQYRIVKIGPQGQRDYVESIFEDDGCPLICGNEPLLAQAYELCCAKRIAENLKKNWLTPHVSVELELINTQH